MSKGQQRGNKEAKKPKAPPIVAAVTPGPGLPSANGAAPHPKQPPPKK